MIQANVYVYTDEVVSAPIAGAVVAVLDGSGVLLAQATTDALGKAAFLLTGSAPGVTYEVRVFKVGTLFANPFGILVKDPLGVGETNNFDVTGTPVDVLPPAVDPRLCRCTGMLRDIRGYPVPGMLVKLAPQLESLRIQILDGALVDGEEIPLRTDATGRVSVDLIRGSRISAIAGSFEDSSLVFTVPDRASANLIDLLFPEPKTVEWDSDVAPGNAVELAVGESLDVPLTLTFSDYSTLPDAESGGYLSEYLTLTVSDEDKITATLTDEGVCLTRLAAGTVTVTPTVRSGLLPSRIPDYAVTVTALTVGDP